MATMVDKKRERAEVNERIGLTVKALLRYRGMTARQLGDAIGEPETTVSKLTKGRQVWQAATLHDTAEVLAVELPMLFEGPTDALVSLGMSEADAEVLLRNSGIARNVGRRGLEPQSAALKERRSAIELAARAGDPSKSPEPAGYVPQAA